MSQISIIHDNDRQERFQLRSSRGFQSRAESVKSKVGADGEEPILEIDIHHMFTEIAVRCSFVSPMPNMDRIHECSRRVCSRSYSVITRSRQRNQNWTRISGSIAATLRMIFPQRSRSTMYLTEVRREREGEAENDLGVLPDAIAGFSLVGF